MKIFPDNWNTVIVGKWNPAILTPKWIAHSLFDKPENTVCEVYVPIDGVSPLRVKIDDLFVSCDSSRLVIDCCTPDIFALEKSRSIAAKAVENLPVTPFQAVGFNIRYHFTDPTEDFIQRLQVVLDERLSFREYKLLGKGLQREIEFEEGRLLMQIHYQDITAGNIFFNFERKTPSSAQIAEWLRKPIDGFVEVHQWYMTDVLGIPQEGCANE